MTASADAKLLVAAIDRNTKALDKVVSELQKIRREPRVTTIHNTLSGQPDEYVDPPKPPEQVPHAGIGNAKD